MSDLEDQPCPGCNVRQRHNPRYPGYFCERCVTEAMDSTGRHINFTNANPSDYLPDMTVAANFVDTGEVYTSENCTIHGIPSKAREARFGGVVVQPTAVWFETGQH